MRVYDIRKSVVNGRSRCEATVQWEDCGRPTQRLFIETDERFGGALTLSGEAIAAGAMLPAMRHGERRLSIEGTLCRHLANGLDAVMVLLRRWYGQGSRRPVTLEPTRGFASPRPVPTPRAGGFLSGGLDSLALFRENRDELPLDHPGSLRDGIVVYGFDLGGTVDEPDRSGVFEDTLAALNRLGGRSGFEVIPIYTNLRHLDDNIDFWSYEFHGAALAAVGHALAGRLSQVNIASTAPMAAAVTEFWGSHPMLDHHYSSGALRVEHEGERHDRLSKARVVAPWDDGLQALRVCLNPNFPRGQLNCGRCEKCIRTMLALTAVGAMDRCASFPVRRVEPALVHTLVFRRADLFKYYEPLAVALRECGRDDLAHVLDIKLAQLRRHLDWLEGKGWKGRLKRWDHRYTGGLLRRCASVFTGGSSPFELAHDKDPWGYSRRGPHAA